MLKYMAAGPLSPEQLRALLVPMRLFNHQARLTGLLLYANESFLQVLEGERAIAESLCQRIRRDPRHTHVETLSEGPALIREFPDWSMSFAAPYAAEMGQLAGYADTSRARFLLPRAYNLTSELLDQLQAYVAERPLRPFATSGS